MGVMKKMIRKQTKKNIISISESILPIEGWLIPSLHISHVHGLARLFLITEIILSFLVVSGTILLTALSFYSR